MPRGVYERKPKTKTEDTVPDTEKTTDADQSTPDPNGTERAPVEGELCALCWPAGWPGDGDAAECSHGTWQR